jgi:hypothetical protein
MGRREALLATISSNSQWPLFARSRRLSDVSNRRRPAVADRGLGRLNWAESAPTGVVTQRTGVRAKPVVPFASEMTLTARTRLQILACGSCKRGNGVIGLEYRREARLWKACS